MQAVPRVGKLATLSGAGHTLEGNSNLTQTLGTSVPLQSLRLTQLTHYMWVWDLFGHDCLFLVDTGAAVSLISLDIWTHTVKNHMCANMTPTFGAVVTPKWCQCNTMGATVTP